MTPTITHPQARAIYDRIGRLQDAQAWYEDRAVDVLITRGDFRHAQAVVEFGCGTGRHAARLLRSYLPEGAEYLGLDISPKMAELARTRLAPWASRARVIVTDGSPRIEQPSKSVDRILSTYVFDLLSEGDIERVLADAYRVLRPGGRLCLATAAPGETPLSRCLMHGVSRMHRLAPAVIGGCRPIDLRPFLGSATWDLLHIETVTVAGIASQAIVAEPKPTDL